MSIVLRLSRLFCCRSHVSTARRTGVGAVGSPSRQDLFLTARRDRRAKTSRANSFWRDPFKWVDDIQMDVVARNSLNVALFASCLVILLTVALGGHVRRSRAGLSMTSWKFLGESFPSTETEWEIEFARYRQIPEYLLSEQDMTLEEFKRIFHLEFIHRVMGRLSGVVVMFAATLLMISPVPGDKVRAAVYTSMVVTQGLLGWYMVQSGFSEDTINSQAYPTVSAVRLAAHMLLGTLLYSLMLYRGITGLGAAKTLLCFANESRLKLATKINHFGALSCLTTIFMGSLVAGTHAGLVHNTFPTMSGKFVPDDLFELTPLWRNFVENQTMVQFLHRNLAYLTAGLTVVNSGLILSSFKKPPVGLGLAVTTSIALVVMQVALGAHCLLTCTRSGSAEHQITGVALMSSFIWIIAELAKLKRGKL